MVDYVEISAGTGTKIAVDEIDDLRYQRIKPVFGVDGVATDVSPGTGMPTSNAYLELTGSASANNTDLIAPIDVRAYAFGSAQLTGTFTGVTVNIQGSNDGITWINMLVSSGTALLGAPATGVSSLSGIYNFSRTTRYIRARTTTYSTGTVNIIIEMFSNAGWQFTSLHNTTKADVTPNCSTPTGDAQSGSFAGSLLSCGTVFNGTNWDRIRNVTNVDGSGSTGLLAAGLVAHDAVGAVNRRVKSDAVGNLYARELPATAAALSSVTSSASTGTLLAANTARRSAIVINESTATLYLAYAATASATAYTQSMAAGSTWEMPMPAYTGAISCIWSAANGAARVTELT